MMVQAGPSIYSHFSNISGTNLSSRAQNSSSVITINSVSSTSSPSNSNKYNLFKSVTSSIKSGTDLIKNTFFSKISSNSSSTATSTSASTKKDAPSSHNKTKNNLVGKLDSKSMHRSPSVSSSDVSDSEDSLKGELIHFKPIVAVPKTNSLSKPKLIRVPSIRPKSETSSVENCFSPCASPFVPINPKTPRKSAFSIVTIQEESDHFEDCVAEPSKVPSKRGRKRKNEKCDNPKPEPSSPPAPPKRSRKQTNQIATEMRVTRSRKCDQVIPKPTKQEENDLEFARKLDEKLNGKITKRQLQKTEAAIKDTKRTYNTRNRKS